MFDKIGMWLDTFHGKRLNRIAAQLLMFPVGLLYANCSARYAVQAMTTSGNDIGWIAVCFAVVDWFCFILLCRTLFHDRLAFGMGALAGFCWLLVGDAVALPFWAGTMALLVHLYRSRKALNALHLWFIFLWILTVPAYRKIYDYSAHPVYLVLFVLLFVGFILNELARSMAVRKGEI